MFGQKYITVYRNLTGAQIPDPKIDLYEGIPDSVLRSTGILTANKTNSNLTPLEQYSYSLTNPEFRKVPGLPVFFTQDEIEARIIGKKYINKPAIAVARLPLNIITGPNSKIQIWRTPAYEKDDYKLTKEILLAYLKGEEKISGECDLRGVKSDLSIINQFVKFLRPEKMVDGYPEGKFIPEGQTRKEK